MGVEEGVDLVVFRLQAVTQVGGQVRAVLQGGAQACPVVAEGLAVLGREGDVAAAEGLTLRKVGLVSLVGAVAERAIAVVDAGDELAGKDVWVVTGEVTL